MTPVSPADQPAAPAAVNRHRKLGRGLASLMSNTRPAAPVPAVLASPDPPPAGATPIQIPAAAYEPVGPSARPRHPGHDGDGLLQIPLERIQPNPYQPRRTFEQTELTELADSIRRQGVLQPLLVMPRTNADGFTDGDYVLIAGERRLRAARMAGLSAVPCTVRSSTKEQMLEWAIVENIQRQRPQPARARRAFQEFLHRFGLTQQQLAERIGLPRATIANYLRILELSIDVQQLIALGQLSFGHAKVLAALLGKAELQLELARKVASGGLSVRQLERLVAGQGPVQTPKPARPPRIKSQHIANVEHQLATVAGTRVTISPGRSKNTGKIILEYYSLDDFDRIVELLGAKLES